jgi:hypothetical protein
MSLIRLLIAIVTFEVTRLSAMIRLLTLGHWTNCWCLKDYRITIGIPKRK